MVSELPVERIRRISDPQLMSCKTTAELKSLEEIIGQERAVRALRFGLEIKERGFNIYVAGSPGTGRTTAVKDFLEEIAKIHGPETGLDWDRFKHTRFALYTIEQKMVLRLTRRQKVERVRGLYVIVDAESLRGRNEIDVARQAIQGGARVIQFRDKVRPRGMLVPISRELKKVCAASDVLFIVNDYLDLAIASDADGLHIGQEDLPVSDARVMLPQDKILGCSAATVAEAVQAEKQGADYVAVGAIYGTASKTDIRPAGLKTLRQVKKKVSVPVVAIGGINEDNVAEVIKAGADAFAVISAVLGATDVKKASQRLSRLIKKNSKH